MIEKRVTGNYEMNLLLTGESTLDPVKVFFSGDTALGKRGSLAISEDGFKVVREINTDTQIWKTYDNIGKPPWKVKILEGVSHHGWWDTVGLARSKNLIDWEYYPSNPALPGLGINADQFDSKWVGWPRMFVKDGIGYVFYTGNAQVGLRTIPLNDLTNWQTEGGQTFDLL